MEDRPDVVWLRPRRWGARGVEGRAGRQHLVEDVLRDRDQGGARTPAQRCADRLADDRRCLGGLADLVSVAGETAEGGRLIDLLERLST